MLWSFMFNVLMHGICTKLLMNFGETIVRQVDHQAELLRKVMSFDPFKMNDHR